MEKKNIIICVIVALLIIALGIGVASFVSKDNSKILPVSNEPSSKAEEAPIIETEEDFNIFSNSADRPIAYMIDNNKNAQPQSNINNAFVVYEIIVEGNETRLMAVFKDKKEGVVGPIRSARHYFLDYAAEYDAIYAHLGLSPQADADMQAQNTNHINGQFYDDGKDRHDGSIYWRDKSRKAPHNAYTSIETIRHISKQLGFSSTTNKGTPLNYSHDEIKLESDDAITVNKVSIPYGGGHVVSYEYDADAGRYVRFSKGNKQYDKLTGDEATTKNLIITFAKNYNLPDKEDKGRQEVVTTGSLDGYYITNGKAIKIKCEKSTRNSQTKYVDLQGNEIKINDGNTWINICPIDANVTFE